MIESDWNLGFLISLQLHVPSVKILNNKVIVKSKGEQYKLRGPLEMRSLLEIN